MEKICRYCKKDFRSSSSNKKYCASCKQITNIFGKVWESNNREKRIDSNRKYRKENLDLCRERTRISESKRQNRIRFGGLRNSVLERDHFSCADCLKDVSSKNAASVHHIDRNKSNNTLENLVTLCKSCHLKRHYVEDRKIDKMGRFTK